MRVRGFEVVSRVEDIFDDTLMPRRSTGKSSGYDFFAFEDVTIPPSISIMLDKDKFLGFRWNVEPTIVKTGIKAYMRDDEELQLRNRSSNPKKLGLIISNGVGTIDSDYYNNTGNEGEIGFMFYNILPIPVTIKKGDKIGQGIFSKYLKVDGDDSVEERLGGFGSTGR